MQEFISFLGVENCKKLNVQIIFAVKLSSVFLFTLINGCKYTFFFSRLGGITKELLWVNNCFVYLDLIGFELTFNTTKLIYTLTL